VHVLAALVAVQAGCVALFGQRRGVLAESPVGLGRLGAALVADVLFAFAVAVGTSRGAAVGDGAVLGLADREYRRLQVEHGRFGIVGLVMTAGTLGIAFQDQVFGGFLGRSLGSICRKRGPRE